MESDREASDTVAEEDILRAHLYSLLGRVLARAPDQATLDLLARLEGDDSDMGQAIKALAAVARRATPDAVDEEFHALFIGVARAELNPYGSYYLTGFLYEKPLAKLRLDMERLAIVRADDLSEPEDHIAALAEMMSGLITGAFGAPAQLPVQQEFFETHLAPWAGRFFQDLERSPSAAFYMPVGTVGRLFMEIETHAFQMAA